MLLGEPSSSAVRTEPPGLDVLRNEALLAAPLAQVVITSDGLVALVNRQAEQLSGSRRTTSAAPSATSRSPTGRWSCAATSTRPRPSGGRCD